EAVAAATLKSAAVEAEEAALFRLCVEVADAEVQARMSSGGGGGSGSGSGCTADAYVGEQGFEPGLPSSQDAMWRRLRSDSCAVSSPFDEDAVPMGGRGNSVWFGASRFGSHAAVALPAAAPADATPGSKSPLSPPPTSKEAAADADTVSSVLRQHHTCHEFSSGSGSGCVIDSMHKMLTGQMAAPASPSPFLTAAFTCVPRAAPTHHFDDHPSSGGDGGRIGAAVGGGTCGVLTPQPSPAPPTRLALTRTGMAAATAPPAAGPLGSLPQPLELSWQASVHVACKGWVPYAAAEPALSYPESIEPSLTEGSRDRGTGAERSEVVRSPSLLAGPAADATAGGREGQQASELSAAERATAPDPLARGDVAVAAAPAPPRSGACADGADPWVGGVLSGAGGAAGELRVQIEEQRTAHVPCRYRVISDTPGCYAMSSGKELLAGEVRFAITRNDGACVTHGSSEAFAGVALSFDIPPMLVPTVLRLELLPCTDPVTQTPPPPSASTSWSQPPLPLAPNTPASDATQMATSKRQPSRPPPPPPLLSLPLLVLPPHVVSEVQGLAAAMLADAVPGAPSERLHQLEQLATAAGAAAASAGGLGA
ncbi:hypothetical protein Agub_g4943, partial [Astrephomene gubernaculifera]